MLKPFKYLKQFLEAPDKIKTADRTSSSLVYLMERYNTTDSAPSIKKLMTVRQLFTDEPGKLLMGRIFLRHFFLSDHIIGTHIPQ